MNRKLGIALGVMLMILIPVTMYMGANAKYNPPKVNQASVDAFCMGYGFDYGVYNLTQVYVTCCNESGECGNKYLNQNG